MLVLPRAPRPALNTQSNKRRGDCGIEAPPPQGGWASHLEGEEDVDDGNDNEEHVKIEETVDEECLSDDDMPRGRTFRFTPSGEAALAVDMASGSGAHTGGHAKGVGLRRRGEGARWDSAALGLGHRGLPKRYSGGNTGAKDSHVWTPLTNPAEMEFYRFAVASDPGKNILRLCFASCYRWQGNSNIGLFLECTAFFSKRSYTGRTTPLGRVHRLNPGEEASQAPWHVFAVDRGLGQTPSSPRVSRTKSVS